jgi:predicted amidohydrolase YtcJ
MKIFTFAWSLLAASIFVACSGKTNVDLLVINATIYTVDSSFSTAEAMALKDGKIVATGKTVDLQTAYAATNTIDAKGQFIYPGWIDAHCHFYGYAQGLLECDLVGTTSWSNVLQRLKTFAQTHPEGWLIGRGWDQNDWTDKAFPNKDSLDVLFGNRPVLLQRVDGHASIANSAALQLANIQPGQQLVGGEFKTSNGQLTGVLIDNAVDIVEKNRSALTEQQIKNALRQAQANCFAQGLTSLQDCGLDMQQVNTIRQLQDADTLQMRLYIMLSDKPANYAFAMQNGKIKTNKLNVSSFKVYGDGALGSRGACLLHSYHDQKNHYGFLLSSKAHYDSIADLLHAKGWQMCTHAIGDSANRQILNTYARVLKGKNDLRWRIEHAQVVDTKDFDLFGQYSIVPSIQPTHATSDMYWAGDRLGSELVKNAYAYQQLLLQNNWLPLGTDFPVEDISALKTFYAAVVRKDAKGYPQDGFQTNNALSRQAALRGMTIWAAKAAFEENEKGSLEKNKLADFVVTDKDLLQCPANELLQVQVLQTWINGKKVYEKQ